METKRPRMREMPNPLTGPVPNWNRNSAAVTVVRLPSRMAEKALSYPWSTARRGVLPRRSSSRMRSKMSTLASTAMPMVRMMPAMPGMVRVACKAAMAAKSRKRFRASARLASMPDHL